MHIRFSEEAWEDYPFWQSRDKSALNRINLLIKDIQRSPFDGIGKPESLRPTLSGFLSRRIDVEHRLVSAMKDEILLIAQCRYHY